MPLNIRNEEVNRSAERLAGIRKVSKTEAVKQALDEALRRENENMPFKERVRMIQERFAKYPRTGLEADKAFYDSLNEE
jgi:antitoxin VapB